MREIIKYTKIINKIIKKKFSTRIVFFPIFLAVLSYKNKSHKLFLFKFFLLPLNCKIDETMFLPYNTRRDLVRDKR